MPTNEVREMVLSDGSTVLVDAADYEWLSRWKWKPHVAGYACRTGWDKTRKRFITILMHRLLIDIPEGCEVDHENRNKRDNRRSNLRPLPHFLNNHNQGVYRSNTSGQRGVVWDKSKGKWMARLTLNGKTHHLGRFADLEDARAAYERARSDLVPL